MGVLHWRRDPNSSVGRPPLKTGSESSTRGDVSPISVAKRLENQSVDGRFGNYSDFPWKRGTFRDSQASVPLL